MIPSGWENVIDKNGRVLSEVLKRGEWHLLRTRYNDGRPCYILFHGKRSHTELPQPVVAFGTSGEAFAYVEAQHGPT